MTEMDNRPDVPMAEGAQTTDVEDAIEAEVADDAPDDAPDDAAGDAAADSADQGADEGADAGGDAVGDAVGDQTAATVTELPRRRSNPESLESEAEIAADYLEELLDIADLDGDIDTFIEGDRAHVSIVSDSDLLVGPGGSVLDALQELARLAVMTETGERSRLMLDVAGFREKRRSELIALATDAVAEVKSRQERVPLTPMNPFERKIVHDAVAAAGLTSESEGEEPKRRVVVLPVA